MSEQREALAEVPTWRDDLWNALSDFMAQYGPDIESMDDDEHDELLTGFIDGVERNILARLLADAEQRGVDRVAAAVEALALNLDRGDSIDRGIATDLRAALTTGAADRVRAEEGDR